MRGKKGIATLVCGLLLTSISSVSILLQVAGGGITIEVKPLLVVGKTPRFSGIGSWIGYNSEYFREAKKDLDYRFDGLTYICNYDNVKVTKEVLKKLFRKEKQLYLEFKKRLESQSCFVTILAISFAVHLGVLVAGKIYELLTDDERDALVDQKWDKIYENKQLLEIIEQAYVRYYHSDKLKLKTDVRGMGYFESVPTMKGVSWKVKSASLTVTIREPYAGWFFGTDYIADWRADIYYLNVFRIYDEKGDLITYTYEDTENWIPKAVKVGSIFWSDIKSTWLSWKEGKGDPPTVTFEIPVDRVNPSLPAIVFATVTIIGTAPKGGGSNLWAFRTQYALRYEVEPPTTFTGGWHPDKPIVGFFDGKLERNISCYVTAYPYFSQEDVWMIFYPKITTVSGGTFEKVSDTLVKIHGASGTMTVSITPTKCYGEEDPNVENGAKSSDFKITISTDESWAFLGDTILIRIGGVWEATTYPPLRWEVSPMTLTIKKLPNKVAEKVVVSLVPEGISEDYLRIAYFPDNTSCYYYPVSDLKNRIATYVVVYGEDGKVLTSAKTDPRYGHAVFDWEVPMEVPVIFRVCAGAYYKDYSYKVTKNIEEITLEMPRWYWMSDTVFVRLIPVDKWTREPLYKAGIKGELHLSGTRIESGMINGENFVFGEDVSYPSYLDSENREVYVENQYFEVGAGGGVLKFEAVPIGYPENFAFYIFEVGWGRRVEDGVPVDYGQTWIQVPVSQVWSGMTIEIPVERIDTYCTISGKVTYGSSFKPLKGIIVYTKGTEWAENLTSEDGSYSLTVPKGGNYSLCHRVPENWYESGVVSGLDRWGEWANFERLRMDTVRDINLWSWVYPSIVVLDRETGDYVRNVTVTVSGAGVTQTWWTPMGITLPFALVTDGTIVASVEVYSSEYGGVQVFPIELKDDRNYYIVYLTKPRIEKPTVIPSYIYVLLMMGIIGALMILFSLSRRVYVGGRRA